ncbi:hypothetical protein B0H34DRAFT_226137 [Crassisporium funariophilum]|nr:hypothetical protein B0H34DRAFT_226137 [Crassisporium funariophilum]
MYPRYLLVGLRSCVPRCSRSSSRRLYTVDGAAKPKSSYSSLYSETFPAMIPVFLLGSAVYLGLQLTQSKLSHEKEMDDASQRVMALEAEIDALQERKARQLENPPTADPPTKEIAKSSRSWW